MPPASKRKTKAAPAPARAHGALRKVFEEPDLVLLVLTHLNAEQLCLCSMVCSRLRSTIDESLALQQQFSRNLLWWGTPAFQYQHTGNVVAFNAEKSHFWHEVTHTESARQIVWQLNIRPVVNMRVCMRMHLFLPLDAGHVGLSGDPERVRKMRARKRASIDVLEWKITRVVVTDSCTKAFLGPLGAMTLCASEYTSNDPRVDLCIKYPIMVTFNDVPVGDVVRFCPLTYRRLWVMRGVRHCMHCHERPPFFQSCNVEAADHSVLCKLCLDLLYVREEQLRLKWRVHKLRVLDIPRAHFVRHALQALSFATPAAPPALLLKSNIARALGYDSWISFIQHNHKFSLKTSARKSRFSLNSMWF
jgi:hypothetical protein